MPRKFRTTARTAHSASFPAWTGAVRRTPSRHPTLAPHVRRQAGPALRETQNRAQKNSQNKPNWIFACNIAAKKQTQANPIKPNSLRAEFGA